MSDDDTPLEDQVWAHQRVGPACDDGHLKHMTVSALEPMRGDPRVGQRCVLGDFTVVAVFSCRADGSKVLLEAGQDVVTGQELFDEVHRWTDIPELEGQAADVAAKIVHGILAEFVCRRLMP